MEEYLTCKNDYHHYYYEFITGYAQEIIGEHVFAYNYNYTNEEQKMRHEIMKVAIEIEQKQYALKIPISGREIDFGSLRC